MNANFEVAWTRANKVAHHMAQNGYTTICRKRCPGTKGQHVHVHDELQDVVAMLGRGNEEELKAFNLQHLDIIFGETK